METLKRSLYIVLSILVGIFLIKFIFGVAVYLIPIILIIFAVKGLKNFIKNKKSNKEHISKVNNLEVSMEDDIFSVENVIEVEYEEINNKQ